MRCLPDGIGNTPRQEFIFPARGSVVETCSPCVTVYVHWTGTGYKHSGHRLTQRHTFFRHGIDPTPPSSFPSKGKGCAVQDKMAIKGKKGKHETKTPVGSTTPGQISQSKNSKKNSTSAEQKNYVGLACGIKSSTPVWAKTQQTGTFPPSFPDSHAESFAVL